MSIPSEPDKGKLIVSIFSNRKSLFGRIAEKLSERFGPTDFISEWMPFDYTTYYEPEMGSGLMRRLISFRSLIEQEDLPDIKLLTNRIEKDHSEDENRIVNIDPGYLLLSRFVLATGKDFTHRVYIGKGIYADLTLLYKNGQFITLPWTYPDYADTIITSTLDIIRRKYIIDLKHLSTPEKRQTEPGE